MTQLVIQKQTPSTALTSKHLKSAKMQFCVSQEHVSNFAANMLTGSAGSSLAKGLSSIGSADWQDASPNVEDTALQAAIADGIVTFVHAAACKQEQLQTCAEPDATESTAGAKSKFGEQAQDGKENTSPVSNADGVDCLELE